MDKVEIVKIICLLFIGILLMLVVSDISGWHEVCDNKEEGDKIERS